MKGRPTKTEYVRDPLQRTIIVRETYHLSASDIENLIRSHCEDGGWKAEFHWEWRVGRELVVVRDKEVKG